MTVYHPLQETEKQEVWRLFCRPTRVPYLLDHTHWLARVAAGLREAFCGSFRSWLSRCRSCFSSHMSTEALVEAL